MRVLLTELAARHFGDRVAAVSPDVEVVVMVEDGSLRLDGTTPISWADARIEAAWTSPDLFVEGGPKRAFLELVETSPTIRWMQAPGAGTNHPMFPTLLSRGTRVTNAHVSGITIAEYVMRAALDHFQGASAWRDRQVRRTWQRHRFREIYHTSWLIVGLGTIGSEVAKRARAFEVRTIGVRRNPSGVEPVDEMITPAALLDAVPRADVIVLAAPATPETWRLVDKEFLAAAREGSLLINVARGALLDEEALVEALDRGRPEAAVLDVQATEPLPEDSPLWTHPRIAITPHNSALGDGRTDRGTQLFLRNLASFLHDGSLENELTPADVHE